MARSERQINIKESHESAAEMLDYVLREESPEIKQERLNLIKVEDALRAERVLQNREQRLLSRVLFVTDNLQVLVDGSMAQQWYRTLAPLFDEIHVTVVLIGNKEGSAFRLDKNIWVYKIYGSTGFFGVSYSRSFIKKHFIFNGAVRPDVIVAQSPFVAGLLAYNISHVLDVPLQIHLSIDIFDPNWQESSPENKKHKKEAMALFKKINDSNSVRVASGAIQAKLQKQFPKITDIDLLPQNYNLSAFKNAELKTDVHELYEDFVFIMATHGPFTADSPLHDVFTAVHVLLQNPRIGLIVIGSGPALHLFREKVKILGIERSVVFVNENDDIVSIYKSCDVFIEAGSSEQSEMHILRAVGAGVPVVTVHSLLRDNLFDDGKTAFLCDSHDPACIKRGVSQLLNSYSLRESFVEATADIAKNRIHEDPTSYYKAMRYHIESAIKNTANESERNSDVK